MCACERTRDVAVAGTAGTEGTEEKSCYGCVKHKYRDKDSKEYKCLVSRLRRIEGQVRGVCKMVEEDRRRMKKSAAELDFNAAAKYRDEMWALQEYLKVWKD